jgi:hypothetical protein
MRNSFRRDPLAKVRAQGQRDRLDHMRNTMSSAEVEAKVRKIIREKLELSENISLDDFRLANLPMDQVNAMFKRALRAVQNEMAMERA